jgi:homoserine kinase
MAVRDIHIRVPATSANLGAGFDSLGIALSLYNDVYFAQCDGLPAMKVEIEGEGLDEIPTVFSENLLCQAMQCVANTVKQNLPCGVIRLVNAIPASRGLGSSAAAIVGGVLLGNELTGRRLSQDSLLKIAADMEGHPDNVAPALLGGLCASVMTENGGIANSLAVPDELKFVVVIPEYKMSTHAARQVLPKQISHGDAVFNVSRVAFLLTCLATRSFGSIGIGLEDRLHVPYRIDLIPGGRQVLAAACLAGALGATISGSGSTLLAITNGDEEKVLAAMIEAFCLAGIAAHGHVLSSPITGAYLTN